MNEDAVRKLIEAKRPAARWTDTHDALAELAVTLAKTLDGDAGMAVAAVSRELRATLAELSAVEDGEDPFDAISRRLSAAMGNPED